MSPCARRCSGCPTPRVSAAATRGSRAAAPHRLPRAGRSPGPAAASPRSSEGSGSATLGEDEVVDLFSARGADLAAVWNNILDGFDNQVIMASTLKELIEVLRDPNLPYGEFNSQFSALHARMPQKLDAQFTQIVDRARARKAEFPAKSLSKAFQRFLEENVASGDVGLLKSALAPMTEVLERYAEGQKVHEFNVMSGILDQYASVERLFSGRTARDEEVILKLRDENKDDILKVVQMVLSHSKVGAKNNLVLAVLRVQAK